MKIQFLNAAALADGIAAVAPDIGFEVTEEHRELILKLLSGEITTDDAFEILKKKYE